MDHNADLNKDGRLNPPKNPPAKVKLQDRFKFDMPFLLLTLTLTVIGIIMMYSASYARAFQEEGNATLYLGKQTGFAIMGIVAMIALAIFDYQWLRWASFAAYGLALVSMICVYFFGSEANGAQRWLVIGGFNFQPSELVKLSVVLLFSTLFSAWGDKMKHPRYGVWFPLGLLVPFVVFLLLQPHLSATIIVCATAACLMFQGGTKIRWFVLLGAVCIVAWNVATETGYTAQRLVAWKNPFSDPSGAGYQVVQSLYAIGSGGLFGQGFGKSRQKYLYLPEEHNDYIFPIVCEELGFVGATLIILLFVLLIIRGYWIAMHAKDRMGALLAGGFTSLLALQVFLNIGVVTNLLPATGISLPFFSYGGTALALQLAQMGVVLSVSRYSDNNLL